MVDALFQPFPMVTRRNAQVWRYQPQWPQWHRPRHFHEEPEINLVTRGRGVMGIGDQTRSVAAGDVLTFHPCQDHVLLEASDDFDMFVMALRPALIDRTTLPVVKATTAFQLEPSMLAQLADELLHLRRVSDGTSYEIRLIQLFERLQPPPTPSHILSRRALQSVLEEPMMSGAALARYLGANPSAVSRQFHQDLGITFVEHRTRVRIIQFVRGVEDGNDFAAAANAAHFGSYSQLHRAFRRTFGCSPREYFDGGRELLNEATFMSLEQIRRGFRHRVRTKEPSR